MTTKAELKALEKVFAAEVENRLPFQSKAAIYQSLLEQGMIQPFETTFGQGWSAVTVKGYQLTHLGRMSYCLSCEGDDE